MAAPSRPKIFSIGWPKTGSNSLTAAMTALGYSTQHLGDFLFKNPTATIRDDIVANYKKKIDPLAGIYDKYEQVPEFVADWPICEVWLGLFDADPAAKFIVTYRDPAETAFSFMRMAWRKESRGIATDWTTDYGKTIEEVTAHYTRIFEYAIKHPARFTIISLRDSDRHKWQAIGAFLDRAIIDFVSADGVIPWPKVYTHEEAAFSEFG